ncbi:hypothetical protein GCM10009720_23650 [Yaniella flava]|uniref:DUF3099 domain-containing protein n=1 Tax=Yaniella flava TaxID=287930 RepID=A0ABN2UY78_9MICC|nr:DUF3099 domain-containing protein [Micrococcaceae bacterium]
MTDQSKTSSPHHRRSHRGSTRQFKKHDDQVYLITGASESVVADAKRKNGFYAITIGVRIASLFVVLITDGWLQIAVFVTGMIAPWIGVQIANNIRQVDGRSIEPIPPQQAALEAASQDAEPSDDDTVIVGDVVHDDTDIGTSPSAESDARAADVGENEKDNDDTRS